MKRLNVETIMDAIRAGAEADEVRAMWQDESAQVTDAQISMLEEALIERVGADCRMFDEDAHPYDLDDLSWHDSKLQRETQSDMKRACGGTPTAAQWKIFRRAYEAAAQE